MAGLREVGAASRELPDRQRVRLLRRLRRALVPDPVEEAHLGSGRAPASRSRQSSSGSSSPTESRRRPGGTRSPSQRARASIRDVTPPRLVAFAISRRGRLDASRGVRVRDVEREETAESRDSGRSARRRGPGAARRSRVRSPSGAPYAPRASRARAGVARPCPRQGRAPCASGTRGGVRHRPRCLHTTAPRSASSWPARYFVAEWTTTSQPSSSGRTCSGVAAVASHTTRAGCAAPPRRSRASSGTGWSAPRARRGRLRRAAARSGRTRRCGRPSARAPRAALRCRSSSPRRARRSSRARAATARPTCTRPPRRRRAAPVLRRARRAAARPRRSSGWRSART